MLYFAPDHTQRENFHQGRDDLAYRYLGAHHVLHNGEKHWHFAVWAPNAKAVYLTGEFCEWKQYDYPMEKQYDGIWELRLPARLFTPESNPQKYNYENAAEKLTSYKYVITGADGQTHLRKALEMNRLYCPDCGTYPEQYYQGAYYPNSREVSRNLPHRFTGDGCRDCGAKESGGLPGDANGDGKANYQDALMVLRYSIGLEKLSEEAQRLCDVDGKKGLNYQDALLIVRASVGLGKLN